MPCTCYRTSSGHSCGVSCWVTAVQHVWTHMHHCSIGRCRLEMLKRMQLDDLCHVLNEVCTYRMYLSACCANSSDSFLAPSLTCRYAGSQREKVQPDSFWPHIDQHSVGRSAHYRRTMPCYDMLDITTPVRADRAAQRPTNIQSAQTGGGQLVCHTTSAAQSCLAATGPGNTDSATICR